MEGFQVFLLVRFSSQNPSGAAGPTGQSQFPPRRRLVHCPAAPAWGSPGSGAQSLLGLGLAPLCSSCQAMPSLPAAPTEVRVIRVVVTGWALSWSCWLGGRGQQRCVPRGLLSSASVGCCVTWPAGQCQGCLLGWFWGGGHQTCLDPVFEALRSFRVGFAPHLGWVQDRRPEQPTAED